LSHDTLNPTTSSVAPSPTANTDVELRVLRSELWIYALLIWFTQKFHDNSKFSNDWGYGILGMGRICFIFPHKTRMQKHGYLCAWMKVSSSCAHN